MIASFFVVGGAANAGLDRLSATLGQRRIQRRAMGPGTVGVISLTILGFSSLARIASTTSPR